MKAPEDFLLEQLPLIERVIHFVCRRFRLRIDDVDEFSAEMKLRLIENDYAILRAYRERSSFATYLTTVVARAVLDYRIRESGRWYASAAATRLGPLAVDLERYLYRDERTLAEALEAILAKHPEVTRAMLEELAAEIPPRARRRNVELNDDDPRFAITPSLATDRERVAARISQTVRHFVEGLSETDRRILRLRFDAELPVSQIARTLGIEQNVAYRHLYRLFRDIRAKLEAEGFDRGDVDNLIGNDGAPLDFHLRSYDGLKPAPLDSWEKVHE